MKCISVECERDLTPTDVSKVTANNRYRFCRICKTSKTQRMRYRCYGCEEIMETDSLLRKWRDKCAGRIPF